MKSKLILPILIFGAMTAAMLSTSMGLAQPAPRTIDITAKRFSYQPNEVTLKKGQPVVLVLKSEDVAHGFRLREFNINIKLKAGGTAQVQFTPEETGDFTAHCSVFCGSGHGSMKLKLHVVD